MLSQYDILELSNQDLDNLNKSNCWSGAAFECEGQPVILYNRNHSDARNESTIMHELSHIILEHKPTTNAQVDHLRLTLRSYDEIHENEANWLGGCLQLPIDGLVWALLKNMNHEEIALHYQASLDMVRFRVNVSGATRKVGFIKKKYRK